MPFPPLHNTQTSHVTIKGTVLHAAVDAPAVLKTQNSPAAKRPALAFRSGQSRMGSGAARVAAGAPGAADIAGAANRPLA